MDLIDQRKVFLVGLLLRSSQIEGFLMGMPSLEIGDGCEQKNPFFIEQMTKMMALMKRSVK
jgi:hypothetical protein